MTHLQTSGSSASRAAGKFHTRSQNRRVAQWALYAGLTVAVLATLLPFMWMLFSSFKTQGELLRRPITWWPEEFTTANYITWFTDFRIDIFFVNSLLVAAVTVLGNLVFCSMIGYALAKMEFRGKKLLFALVMVTLMVPGVVTFVGSSQSGV